MLVHRRVTPSIKFAGTHLYTWVERGTARAKYLGLEPGPLVPETSAQTMGPPRLPNLISTVVYRALVSHTFVLVYMRELFNNYSMSARWI